MLQSGLKILEFSAHFRQDLGKTIPLIDLYGLLPLKNPGEGASCAFAPGGR
jgi:hypothetical protein